MPAPDPVVAALWRWVSGTEPLPATVRDWLAAYLDAQRTSTPSEVIP